MRCCLKILVLVAPILLVGCARVYGEHGFIKDSGNNYWSENTLPPLVVPADLSSAPLNDDYVVPAGMPVSPQMRKPVELLPPGSIAEQIAHGKLPKDALKRMAQQSSYAVSDDTSGIMNPKDVAQTWNAMRVALPKTGYRIIHTNSQLHVYFILDKYLTHDRVTPETPIYEVRMRELSDQSGTEIYLTDISARALPKEINTRVLADINDALRGKNKSNRFTRWFSELY